MNASNVASEVSLAAVLRSGSARILAQRPMAMGFGIEAACDAQVTPGQAALIVAVLREAIFNSIDYSHPAGVAGRIVLSSARQQDGKVDIRVWDDGVGLPEGFDPHTDGGVGFRTMRRASLALGADLSFSSSCLGLSVCLTLPAMLAGGKS